MSTDEATPTALDLAISRVEEENASIATVGCILIDRLRRACTVDNLEALKSFVRSWIQQTDAQLAIYRHRDRRRTPHFAGRIRRKPQLGRAVGVHTKALQLRNNLYKDRRIMLKELGDAALWLTLNMDVRRTALLYSPSTHEYPTGIGLAGVVQLQHQLHASGHFLAMESDLTRCSGVGDLVVVRADAPQGLPLPVEVKTHAEDDIPREGTFVEILTLTSASNHPRDQENLALLTDTIGKDLEDELVVSPKAEKQAGEIARRVEHIARALYGGTKQLPPPVRNWAILRNAVRRAEQHGYAFDLAEDGVYYFAMRTGRDLSASLKTVRDAIRTFEPGVLRAGLSTDVHAAEQLSGIILPIALWDLPRDIRAAILSNRIVVGTFMRDQQLARLFSGLGITFVEDETGWLLTRGGAEIHFTPLDALATRLAIVAGCVSPRSVVERLARSLDDQVAN